MKKQIGKLFIEGFLIIFSVLFALYINRLSENSKMEKRKTIAIERIKKELHKNSEIIKQWHELHSMVKDKTTQVVENKQDSLRQKMLQYDFLNLAVLTNDKSLVDAVLTDVSWEAAKATDVIAELDYELVEKLTYVYTMQQHLMDDTLQKILDFYFSSSAHDMNNFNATMLQFQLRFSELVGQEYLLEYLYKTAIDEIEK
jgi:hypothetical protein